MFALQQVIQQPGEHPKDKAVNKVVVEKLKAKTYDEIRQRVLEESKGKKR